MRRMALLGIGCLWGMGSWACEPPAKPANPAPAASSTGAVATTAPSASASSGPVAATSASSVAAQPLPVATVIPAAPCPPEAPQPADALAWVSGCKILMAEKIYFDTEKDRIKPRSFPLLEAVGDVLAKNPDLEIEIQGHSGDPHRESYGRKLTQDRAQSVMKFLIAKKGIEPVRLQAKGYENSMPIADSRTEEGRAQNRRIELVIIKWRAGNTRPMWPPMKP